MGKTKTVQNLLKKTFILNVIIVIFLTAAVSAISYFAASGQLEKTFAPKESDSRYMAAASIFVNGKSGADKTTIDSSETETTAADSALAGNFALLLTQSPRITSLAGETEFSITQIEDKNFIKITVYSENPKTAANVANQIADTAPEVFKEYFDDNGTVRTVRAAYEPANPVEEEQDAQSPNTLLIVLIAALGTLVAGLIPVTILTLSLKSSYRKKNA